MTTETNDASVARPVQIPPQSAAGDAATASTAAGGSAPTLTTTDVAAIVEETTTAPTLAPPAAVQTAGDEAVTATWRNNVQVTAMWSIDETRNAFMHVAGVGWKKIYNGRDGAFQALVSLASQARQTNRPVNIREEADGMIYEIYLW